MDDFSAALLTQANVAVIPGSGFGSPDTIRLSYATSIDLLEEAIRRIRAFVEQIGKNDEIGFNLRKYPSGQLSFIVSRTCVYRIIILVTMNTL